MNLSIYTISNVFSFLQCTIALILIINIFLAFFYKIVYVGKCCTAQQNSSRNTKMWVILSPAQVIRGEDFCSLTPCFTFYFCSVFAAGRNIQSPIPHSSEPQLQATGESVRKQQGRKHRQVLKPRVRQSQQSRAAP